MCAVQLSPAVVAYMDSLYPGSEPPETVVKQIEESFRLNKKYCIRSLLCQRQGASDCLVCATANLDAVLTGNDVSKIKYDQKLMRSYFVESLIAGRLFFPSGKFKTRGDVQVFSMKCRF